MYKEKSDKHAVTLSPPEDTDEEASSEVVLLARLLASRPPLRFLSLTFILVTEGSKDKISRIALREIT